MIGVLSSVQTAKGYPEYDSQACEFYKAEKHDESHTVQTSQCCRL
jgi:hypothetical protein